MKSIALHSPDTTCQVTSTPISLSGQQKSVLEKVRRRMLPILMLCYFAAFLDRVNVGVAALQMNADLGLTNAQFGLGAGLFCGLRHIRSAEQSSAGASWCAPMDSTNSHQLGSRVGMHGFGLESQ